MVSYTEQCVFVRICNTLNIREQGTMWIFLHWKYR